MANIYSKLADKIEKYPKRIIATWFVILLLALPLGFMTLTQPGVLQYDMTSMVGDDKESVKGMNILADTDYFGTGSTGMDPIIVVELPADPSTDPATQNMLNAIMSDFNIRLIQRYDSEFLGLTNAGYYTNGGTGGVTLLALQFDSEVKVSGEIDTIRSLLSDTKSYVGADFQTYVTGSSAIGHDTEAGAMSDIERIDPFSILLVLILIGLFFRSFISAATPPCVIGFAYAMVLAVIYGLSQIMGIYYMTSTIVLIAMLGAGCDYCIFILSRYREERIAGKDHNGALREAVIWAGESITTSGISVIIGFGAMAICDFSMIRTMGIVLACGIVFALLAALTLIPAIIAVAGDRIFYPNRSLKLDPEGKTMNSWYGSIVRFGHRYFRSSAEHATKYAAPIVIAALLVTLPLGYVALNNSGSFDMVSTMPSGEAKDGVNAITENAYGGLVMPTYVLMEVETNEPFYNVDHITAGGTNIPQLVWTQTGLDYNDLSVDLMIDLWDADGSLTKTFSGQGGGNIAYALGMLDYNDLIASLVNTTGLPESVVIEVFAAMLPEAVAGQMNNIAALQAAGLITSDEAGSAIDYILNVGLGTVSAYADGKQYIKFTVVVKDEPMSDRSMETVGQIKDFVADYSKTADGQNFSASYVTGSVAVIDDMAESINSQFRLIEIVVVILIALLLFFVMRSYLTPIRSIVTIVMSILWTLGLTFIVFQDLMSTPVTFIMPIILFVICLGLGMDYDILLTTRIRENVSKGMSNDRAIKEAIVRSGSVITICGLIMAGAFGTMMLSTSPMLQEMGFALCFAIGIDALVVRTYIVPAMMHLMGKWNWVGPKWLNRNGVDVVEILAKADDDGSLNSADEYLDCNIRYRFCTHFRTGMYALVSVIAFFAAVFISWTALGRPGLETLAFVDIVKASGNAGTAATISMLVSAVFAFFAGMCAANCMKGTGKLSGFVLGAGALGILAAIFLGTSEAWTVAFCLIALSSVAMFRPVGGATNAFQSGIAVMTAAAMIGAYFTDILYVSMAFALVSMCALLVTSVMHILRDD
ncbi:MAG: MMPL family transporter [Candidatus Methanomethylophilaceae archaeon]|nr:MMPL family transporter [Candidatus Methanomethylophilaceae archaeon]MDY5872156.1 MMPL family transporter [Candidatus Methanomethylophilaceae archaeon]